MTKVMFCKLKIPVFQPQKFLALAIPCTASVFFESQSRIEEIALYVMPRFMDLAWNLLKKFKIVNRSMPGFLYLAFAVSIGFLGQIYVKDNKSMKSKYKVLASKIIGDDLKKDSVDRDAEGGVEHKSGNPAVVEESELTRVSSSESFFKPVFPGPGFM
jgi:hypothetical protein